MLTREDNELITNTNPGTPMGDLFRRFWLPVALSEELPGPDCVPIRVKVLGEDLIGIRDTSGRPGLFDAYCPHRGAPLFFGRNEADGLRGDPSQNFQTRNQANVLAPVNQGGLRRPTTGAWGNSDPNEPFPRSVGDRRVTEKTARAAGAMTRIEDHEQAMLSVNLQEQPDGKVAASVGVTWWMPIFCTAGIAAPGHFSSNMRIPIDNESLMFYRLRWSWEPISEADLHIYKHGGYTHPETIPGTWMPQANLQNDYQVDRVAQKNFSYS